jgi:hypothetical protein
MSFEGQQVFYTDQNLMNDHIVRSGEQDQPIPLDEAKRKFMHFVLETQEQNKFIYRD